MRVLITGATGFVASHLLPELGRAGHELIGLSRDPQKSQLGIPLVKGDLGLGTGLQEALEGIEVAYYLVHSFEQTNAEGFERRDRRAAQLFAMAARRANLRRIVYCGVSPSSSTQAVTAHRKSRAEVADILMQAVPDTVCLRTWTILSPRNQFIRFLLYMLRRRSVITLPPSSRYRSPPIDARDLALALVAAATSREVAGKVVDVVGPSVIDGEQLCRGLCEQLGLERRFWVLPFAPPDLLLRGVIRAAGLDPIMVLSALSSARAGDVLPENNALDQLVSAPHSLRESLAYAAC